MSDMKKYIYILLCLLTVSCAKTERPAVDESTVIYVTIDSPSSRVRVGTSGLFAWQAGDSIAVFNQETKQREIFKLHSGAGMSTASFDGRKMDGELFYAYYPVTAKCDGKTFKLSLPVQVELGVPVQIFDSMPLLGVSTDLSSITVNSLCGVLQLNVSGTGKLKSAALESVTKAISGEMLYNIEYGIQAMGVTASHIIMMNAEGTELSVFRPTPLRFILPPEEYNDLKLTLTWDSGASQSFLINEPILITKGALIEKEITK